jgi:hypothetical protein
VTEFAKSQLSGWQNFYVIVGSSGGAIVGIQFVVIALIADMRRRAPADSIGAFATPTLMHLGSALLVSAIMSAPWPALFPASVALAVCSVAGFGYGIIVIHRARRQKEYKPVWEDWLWHAILPCSVYVALGVAALFLRAAVQAAMFVIGAVALSLLFIGIHNAWDSVTYMVATGPHEDSTDTE